MLRKSTGSSRATRSSTANATVLKPSYPNPTGKKQTQVQPVQQQHQNNHNLPPQTHHHQTQLHQQFTVPHLDSTTSFLLPSSEFFVVDKDSLVLSESDIFQTNLARKPTSITSGATNIRTNTRSINDGLITSSPMIKPKSRNQTVLSSAFTEEEEEDEEASVDLDEKENNNLIYGAFLNNNINSSMARKPGISSISGMKAPVIRTTPDEGNSHVLDRQQQPQQSNSVVDKGLRHFSAKVCAKVEEKGVTTYNEVADELVREIGLEMGKCDHKNIRRRVYDALNVLMAIDIIRKEKKEIRWLGLPNEADDDLRALETERQQLQERISEKSKNLREILRRCISLKNLIDRNAELQQSSQSNSGDKLPLPFILISAARDCHVHCEMLEDRTQYFFEFNTSFQINEDIELMRLMGLDTGRIERIKSFFPKELVAQVLLLCLGTNSGMGVINSSNQSSHILCDPSNNAITNNNTNTTNSNNNNTNNNSNSNTRSIFAPIINNEDLNLGDLETFSTTSSSTSLSSSNLSSSL